MIWFFAVVVLAVVAAVAIWFLHRFYVKANRETALVRTGLGGQRVIMDGGCPALPILHQVQKVSMRAMAIRVARDSEHSLLTGDRLRADVEMEFEVRVAPNPEGVATAARALGQRIARGGEAVEELLWGQLVNAMQDAAAARTLDEMHKDRAGYTGEVAGAVRAYMENLGLRLISAALVRVDQGSLAHLEENNAFNSEGIRKLASLVAENLMRAVTRRYLDALRQVDLLLMPTLPMKAPPIPPPDCSTALYVQRAFEMVGNTVAFSASGLPAMSIPCGLSGGLPIGMMLVGSRYGETTIYRAAHAFEQSADWRTL